MLALTPSTPSIRGSDRGDPQEPATFLDTQRSSTRPRPRPKSSAIRDYPDGCVRRSDAQFGRLHPAVAATIEIEHHPKEEKLELENIAPMSLAVVPVDSELRPDPFVPEYWTLPPSSRLSKKRKTGASRSSVDSRALTRLSLSTTGNETLSLSISHYNPRKLIVETLRAYETVRRSLLLEEGEVRSSRADLQAGVVLRTHGLCIVTSKQIGPLPGVDVGDIFFFRMELCCIGLHRHIQGGIDFLNAKETHNNVSVAVSIISAGVYDSKDTGDVLIYTGQGGRSAVDGKQNEDQKLRTGNLALQGNSLCRLPVRVIRGIKDFNTPSGKIYIYDGLYMVDEVWSEKGKLGFHEFKFKLSRLPDQPMLGSAILNLSNQLKHKPHHREGLCVDDIASGKEKFPVCVINTIDNERGPNPFCYSTSMQYLCTSMEYFHEPAADMFGGPEEEGCGCSSVCNSLNTCSCLRKNGICYLSNGVLVKERGIIYECGDKCNCPPSCANRTTQRPPNFRFEIFKTEDRGWGLRSQDVIPAGSFVCAYVGQLVDHQHLLKGDDYVLDLNILPNGTPGWGDAPGLLQKREHPYMDDTVWRPRFIIDSTEMGNVARFINHSCFPNLLVQCVSWDQYGKKLPRAMLFAMDNIPPFTELTLDYGTNQQGKGQICLCKSLDCRGMFGS